MDRDKILDTWMKRPLSWSQLSQFWYSKNKWVDTYLLNNRFPPNAGMDFGNVVGDTLGLGKKKSMVPKLEKYLTGEKEHEMHVKLNKKMLVGYADHYCPEKKILNENKTSQKIDRWNQKAVDTHGQLTMYALMILLRDGTIPDQLEIWLNFIPVENRKFGGMWIPDRDEFHRFQTTRTAKECLAFGSLIERTHKDMEQFANVVKLPDC